MSSNIDTYANCAILKNDTVVNHFDSLANYITIQNDTIVHKIHLTMDESEGFFKMDNPFWYVLTLLIVAIATHIMSRNAKKSEAVTEAKKIFLDKRIETHQKLYEILSKGKRTTSLPTQTSDIFYRVFNTTTEFNDWFDELLNFAGNNKTMLSHDVNVSLSRLNILRININRIIKLNSFSNSDLQNFANKYHQDIKDILNKLEDSIKGFFENEIELSYKFGQVTEKETAEIGQEISNYKIITDFLNPKK